MTCVVQGNVVLFLAERRAVRDGREIRLTPREAGILGLLMAANGQPVPWRVFRDDPEWVRWEVHEIRDSLKVHVRALRMKLGAGVVESVAGVGYRIGDGQVERCPRCGRAS